MHKCQWGGNGGRDRKLTGQKVIFYLLAAARFIREKSWQCIPKLKKLFANVVEDDERPTDDEKRNILKMIC